MKAIRVIAVGLVGSAVVMSQLSIEFYRQWSNSTAVNAFILAMKSLSPSLFSGTGMGGTAVIILTFTSAGLGLLLSAVLYSPLDDLLAGVLKGRGVVSSKAAQGGVPSSNTASMASDVRTAS